MTQKCYFWNNNQKCNEMLQHCSSTIELDQSLGHEPSEPVGRIRWGQSHKYESHKYVNICHFPLEPQIPLKMYTIPTPKSTKSGLSSNVYLIHRKQDLKLHYHYTRVR